MLLLSRSRVTAYLPCVAVSCAVPRKTTSKYLSRMSGKMPLLQNGLASDGPFESTIPRSTTHFMLGDWRNLQHFLPQANRD